MMGPLQLLSRALANLVSLAAVLGSDSLPPTDVRFAAAVAFAEGDLVVGRPGPSARPHGGGGGVHIFRRTPQGTWREVAVLAPPDVANGDEFGAALAVDGSRLAVGAPGAHDGRGAIYLFERARTGRWHQRAKLTDPAGAPGDRLGQVLALRGTLLLAGEPAAAHNRGQVVVFRQAADGATGASRWREQARLQRPAAAAAAFPWPVFARAVAIAGERLVISTLETLEQRDRRLLQGRVLIFRDSAQQWVEEARLTGAADTTADTTTHNFGATLLSEDTTLWVAAPMADEEGGVVYPYRRDAGGRWRAGPRLRAPAPRPGVRFGAGLARAGRDELVVGAPGDAALYVLRYEPAAAAWAVVQRLPVADETGRLQVGERLAASPDVILTGLAKAESGAGAGVLFHRDPAGAWQPSGQVIDTAWAAREPLTGRVRRCRDSQVKLFECWHTELLAFLPISALGGGPDVELSGLWGWTDSATGREFALVGRSDGMAVVDVTDPVRPHYLGELPLHPGATPSSWRDIKVYQHHAFIVADGAGSHGVQVFDLTRLRELEPAAAPTVFAETAHYDRIASAHTIAANEATGFMYLAGANGGGESCGGGLHMIDVRRPTQPRFAGCYTELRTGGANGAGYVHETQCVVYHGPDRHYQGHEICLTASGGALGVADVTDKPHPTTLSIATYPNLGYVHQGWFTEDQRYFFVDDELDDGAGGINKTRTIVFDLKDLDQPVVLTESYGTTAATDHNLYIRGHYMYQANYAAGLRVIDIRDPVHPREVGYFDTAPAAANEPGYRGAWSNYPYFARGVVGVTSRNEGLFLLRYRP